MIKAIIFDLDDTLISEYDYIRSGYKYVSRKIVEMDMLPLSYEAIYDLMIYFFLENKKNVFNRLFDFCGIKYSDENIHMLVGLYRSHVPEITFLENADILLDELRKEDYKLGIITDGYAISQRNKVNALGLNNLVDYICITDEIGKEFWKPHPVSYLRLLKKLDCLPEECIYIGDNENKDFITAKLLGIKTIMIERENAIHVNNDLEFKDYFKADEKIVSLWSLKKILE